MNATEGTSERYTPCPVCRGQRAHAAACPVPALGPPKPTCTCDAAEVEQGKCILCGKPFPVGGAV